MSFIISELVQKIISVSVSNLKCHIVTALTQTEGRGETIQVKVVMRIVFECTCIAMYCHIAICDWVLVRRHFIYPV